MIVMSREKKSMNFSFSEDGVAAREVLFFLSSTREREIERSNHRFPPVYV
jgi:hypothetical protein